MTAEGLLTACLLDLSDCGLALSCGLWSCFDHGPLFGRLCSCWGLYVVVVGLVWSRGSVAVGGAVWRLGIFVERWRAALRLTTVWSLFYDLSVCSTIHAACCGEVGNVSIAALRVSVSSGPHVFVVWMASWMRIACRARVRRRVSFPSSSGTSDRRISRSKRDLSGWQTS